MKRVIAALIFALSLTLTLVCSGQTFEVERIKSDLIGKVMGGREKGWKFQSLDQIKELVITDKKEEAQRRVYSLDLKLQDPRSPGLYKAKADVTYERVDSRWEIKTVGLKYLMKVE